MKPFLTFFIFFIYTLCFGFTITADASHSHAYIIIDRNTQQLHYLENNKVQRSFHVTTGKPQTPTPAGSFKVVYKEENRPYYKANISGGSPKNPLGSRWIGLDVNHSTGNVYGIHGTNQPGTIGLKVSNGCIRMKNSDVEWLYPKAHLGMKVIIR
ncbi:L,D-transpeptidase [Bacillus cereus group sp. BfR-BA-01349]|uniref:L,D-transpeptidase n=1 Tax=Bacillus cereus group sp. BfR-BA-01349 TaxID=2920312 RepID=UPI001F58DA7D